MVILLRGVGESRLFSNSKGQNAPRILLRLPFLQLALLLACNSTPSGDTPMLKKPVCMYPFLYSRLSRVTFACWLKVLKETGITIQLFYP